MRVKSLLEHRFAPVTFCWGFVERPLNDVAESVFDWLVELAHSRKAAPTVDRQKLSGDLASLLRSAEPLKGPEDRKLLVSTQSRWTACFSNRLTDTARNTVSVICSRLKCWGIGVEAVPDTIDRTHRHGAYGAVQMYVYSPEPPPGNILNHYRVLSVVNDGGRWSFDELGTQLDFETPERYGARRIRDRFTSEMLEEYCESLGIRLFDADFYGPDAVVVSEYFGGPGMSYADAQRDLRLDTCR